VLSWASKDMKRLQLLQIAGCALVASFGFTAAAQATTIWSSGDVTTYNQAAWPLLSASSTALTNNFSSVYASTFGVMEIGIPGPTGHSAVFSSSDAVTHFLPATGTPAALDADLNNPVTTSAGIFGGDVLALQLNVDFSDAGVLTGAAGVHFGDLMLYGLTGPVSGLNGQMVRSFASIANTGLGGGITGYSLTDLDSLADEINAAFNDGTVTAFAQQHLEIASAPPGTSVPEPGSAAMLVSGLVGWAAARRRRAPTNTMTA